MTHVSAGREHPARVGETRHTSAARRLEWIEHAGDALLHDHADRRTRSWPGLRLLAAILDDARLCLTPGATVDAATRADAIAWVNGEIRSAPLCSFHEICALLDLDEERVRAALLGERTWPRRHALHAVRGAAHRVATGALISRATPWGMTTLAG